MRKIFEVMVRALRDERGAAHPIYLLASLTIFLLFVWAVRPHILVQFTS